RSFSCRIEEWNVGHLGRCFLPHSLDCDLHLQDCSWLCDSSLNARQSDQLLENGRPCCRSCLADLTVAGVNRNMQARCLARSSRGQAKLLVQSFDIVPIKLKPN